MNDELALGIIVTRPSSQAGERDVLCGENKQPLVFANLNDLTEYVNANFTEEEQATFEIEMVDTE